MCAMENMPKYESSHEMTMKRKRQADKEAYNAAMDKSHEAIDHWQGGSRFGRSQGRGAVPIMGHDVKLVIPNPGNQPPPPAWAGEKR